MLERADKDLAFMLQYENVAWYEKGIVKILDRRIYPLKTEFVTCHTHQEVAQAIKDMVTQSAGPYLAAGMGMALAAYECRNMGEEEQIEYLKAISRPQQETGTVCGEYAVEWKLQPFETVMLKLRKRYDQ